jgi:hypothetical protein
MPCCWAEQGGNEVECLGLAAPLDGSERLRCSDCREQSWRPTAEDLVPSRDCLYHQRVIFYILSYLAMTGCWHSFSLQPSAWPTSLDYNRIGRNVSSPAHNPIQSLKVSFRKKVHFSSVN